MALNENLKKCNLGIFRSKLENFKKINVEQNTIFYGRDLGLQMFVNVVVVNWKNYGRKARNLQILASFCPFVIVQIYVFKNKPFFGCKDMIIDFFNMIVI